MEQIIDFILHIDEHLATMIAQYGYLTYAILFAIVFAETGFVVTPFLPGDSLLFGAGAIAAVTGGLNPWLIIIVCICAAFIGNMVNYKIGFTIGDKILDPERYKFIKREYLVKTHAFYEKHGALAIVLGRFLPIVRTFVPFVAGIGQMDWRKFTLYNLLGAVVWVTPFTLAGFYLGEVPFVKDNFEVIMLSIIVVTLLPTIIGVISQMMKKK